MSIHEEDADPATGAITNDPLAGRLQRPPVGGPQDIFYQRAYATRFPTLARGEASTCGTSVANAT